ncbi:hypothetical protein AUP68_16484 [Ilyonectria robusta]
MKAFFLLTILAGVALAHPTRDTVHIEGGCWVDEDGKSHCDNTPVCTENNGTMVCIAK